MNCPVCSQHMGVLGQLGSVTHYQCRACGMTTHSRSDSEPWPAPVLRAKEPPRVDVPASRAAHRIVLLSEPPAPQRKTTRRAASK